MKARLVLAAAVSSLVTIPVVAADKDYYPKRDWEKLNGGNMNTSSFVFRDINRNGIYDVGDRPMAYVAVVMDGPGADEIMRRTNLSGFANFKMSVADRDQEVVNPGHYTFRVVPPPGWTVSTANGLQEGDYRILPGAPGDMVALSPTHPVGLVPELTISGRATPGTAVTLSGPDGVSRSIEADSGGRFAIAASPGAWTVETGDANARTVRHVTLESDPVIVSAKGEDVEAGEATVIDFDRLMMSEAVLEIPSGQQGLNWFNIIAMHQRFAEGPGYVNGTVSGEFIAYNSSGHPARVWSDRPFDFLGASFAVGWNNGEGETLTIRAFRGEELAHEDAIVLSAMGPVRFRAGYRNITRVEFATQHYWQMTMDDFSFRAVEPAQ